jgi:hypothetical protein
MHPAESSNPSSASNLLFSDPFIKISIKGRESTAKPMARKNKDRFPERKKVETIQQKAIKYDIKRRGPNKRLHLKIRELWPWFMSTVRSQLAMWQQLAKHNKANERNAAHKHIVNAGNLSTTKRNTPQAKSNDVRNSFGIMKFPNLSNALMSELNPHKIANKKHLHNSIKGKA